MPVQTFSTNFVNTVKSLLPLNTTCGLSDSVLNGIDPQYRVTITAVNTFVDSEADTANSVNKNTAKNNTTTVNAYLQEKIKIHASAEWEGVSEIFGSIDKMVDVAAQALTTFTGFATRSLVSTVGSRRKWCGSSPISISLHLKFEAVEDIWKEVLAPCLALQQLVAPREGKVTAGFFLIPPGPSPFALSKNDMIGEKVTIKIGEFIEIENAIIKDVSITYENRMSKIGPVGAEADIVFETYEMMTKQGIAKMYTDANTAVSSLVDKGVGTSSTPVPQVAGIGRGNIIQQGIALLGK